MKTLKNAWVFKQHTKKNKFTVQRFLEQQHSNNRVNPNKVLQGKS